MTTNKVSQIDHTIQLTYVWLGELMTILDWTDRSRAWHALHAVLPALRDHLPLNESAHLAAQLPLLIRGLYFESWHPATQPLRDRSGDDFIEHIAKAFVQTPDAHPSEIAAGVFALLERHVTAGEIAQVKKALPEGVRRYWPIAPMRPASGGGTLLDRLH